MIIKFDLLEKYNNEVVHGFSTKLGGVSQGHFATMNLKINSEDSVENIMENFKRFSEQVGVSIQDTVLTCQKHDNYIRVVTSKDRGKGLFIERDYDNVDALITNEKDLVLTTFHADCLPVYFYDPVKKAVGIAHAGWGGTAKEIVKEVIIKMKEVYASHPKDIIMAIGPGLCQNCFEVDDDVYQIFKAMPYEIDEFIVNNLQKDKYYIDLKSINVKIAMTWGIDVKNIYVSPLCTKEKEELFYSHRRQGNERGTMCGMISLK